MIYRVPKFVSDVKDLNKIFKIPPSLPAYKKADSKSQFPLKFLQGSEHVI